jgi:Damage-control phosphatase ARMT1-like domain
MFIDNAGADAVLGMIPLAREFLCMGAEVVLAANSHPALNDVTAPELEHLIDTFCAPVCPIIDLARRAARAAADACATASVPPFPGTLPRPPSRGTLSQAADPFGSDSSGNFDGSAGGGNVPGGPTARTHERKPSFHSNAVASPQAGSAGNSGGGGSSIGVEPKLFVCSSGGRGPCLDLRAVSREVAEACAGVDLVVIEGMGRAVHTNYHARFKCSVLKLAMIKTQWVAERLFGGKLFDCMCRFDEGRRTTA